MVLCKKGWNLNFSSVLLLKFRIHNIDVKFRVTLERHFRGSTSCCTPSPLVVLLSSIFSRRYEALEKCSGFKHVIVIICTGKSIYTIFLMILLWRAFFLPKKQNWRFIQIWNLTLTCNVRPIVTNENLFWENFS